MITAIRKHVNIHTTQCLSDADDIRGDFWHSFGHSVRIRLIGDTFVHFQKLKIIPPMVSPSSEKKITSWLLSDQDLLPLSQPPNIATYHLLSQSGDLFHFHKPAAPEMCNVLKMEAQHEDCCPQPVSHSHDPGSLSQLWGLSGLTGAREAI